jgi:phage baseplate assembly protein W
MDYPLPSNDPLGTDLQLDANGDLVIDRSGSLQTVTAEENVQQALRVNLATSPDTYLWDEDVGTHLVEYVDEPITSEMEKEIIAIVTDKALEDDRILDVSEVIVDDSYPDCLVIFVSATVSGVGDVQIPITVTGGV